VLFQTRARWDALRKLSESCSFSRSLVRKTPCWSAVAFSNLGCHSKTGKGAFAPYVVPSLYPDGIGCVVEGTDGVRWWSFELYRELVVSGMVGLSQVADIGGGIT